MRVLQFFLIVMCLHFTVSGVSTLNQLYLPSYVYNQLFKEQIIGDDETNFLVNEFFEGKY